MRRRRALAVSMVVVSAAIAGAETTSAPPRAPWRLAPLVSQWRPGLPESEALRIPSPITRDDQVDRVTLKETIGIALENNPAIAAQRLEPFRQTAGILSAQAEFDPTFAAEVGRTRSTTPNASALAGAIVTKTKDEYANAHLFKTFRSGTLATIDFLNDRLETNSRFSSLSPQIKPQLNLSLVQPLLRNFGWDFSYLVVRVAERTADAAIYEYQAQLADFVDQVIEAYWNVVRARENLEVQRESMALADRTVEENQARVRVGLLPPVATLEAQADAKSREELVIKAENDLAVTRQRLAQTAFYRPQGTFVPRMLEPAEEAMPEDVEVDVDDALAVALAVRPEIQGSARRVEAQLVNERIAENGLLPQLDLVGSYGVQGLSGTNRASTSLTTGFTTIVSPIDLSIGRPGVRCVPTTSAAHDFLCRVPQLAAGPSPFAGPTGDAYDRLTSNDFNTYSFGLQLNVPLSNAAARGQLDQTRVGRAQAELNHRSLLSNVTFEVRQFAADVTSARQRIDTTRVARELAEENLRNQQKRHDVGMATTKDLLDFQTRLTSARAAEVQAKIDYAIAVAHWRRARGELLVHYQVMVEHPGVHSPPWFARF